MDIPKPLCPLFVPVQVVLGVLPTAVSPFAALCPFPRTPVLVPGSASFSPWGGSTLILEAGDSRAAPATTHQLPNAIGGTRSSPSTRGAWPNPGGWPKTQKEGSWHSPAHILPFTPPAATGHELGVPSSPQHLLGQKQKGKSPFLGSFAVPGCCSSTVLLQEPAGCAAGAGRGRAERRLRAAARLSCALVLIRSRKTLIKALQECEGNLA